jgi:hypothetical protein
MLSNTKKYIINLKKRPNRLEHIIKEMNYMGFDFEIFEGIEKNSHEGCALSHIEIIKEALWKNKSPVLVNYNHGGFWHVVLIVGYDDQLPGKCMLVSESDCDKDLGSFYVRDSAEGMSISVRDYDWFRILGNTAILIREVK